MDKESLAHKLYVERVNELMGDHQIDETILEQMWESKATPAQAAKAMCPESVDPLNSPGWVQRYLKR
jgi:hypothetical protein